MKLSTLVWPALVVTFIAAILVGDYFGNISTSGNLHDWAFILVFSTMLTSAVVSGLVIDFLLSR